MIGKWKYNKNFKGFYARLYEFINTGFLYLNGKHNGKAKNQLNLESTGPESFSGSKLSAKPLTYNPLSHIILCIFVITFLISASGLFLMDYVGYLGGRIQ